MKNDDSYKPVRQTVALVLAGGRGSRLHALTEAAVRNTRTRLAYSQLCYAASLQNSKRQEISHLLLHFYVWQRSGQ
jgi:hypothetical protein